MSRVLMETRWIDGSSNVAYKNDIAQFGQDGGVLHDLICDTGRVPNLVNVDGLNLTFEVTCSDSSLSGAVYLTEMGWNPLNTSRYPIWSKR